MLLPAAAQGAICSRLRGKQGIPDCSFASAIDPAAGLPARVWFFSLLQGSACIKGRKWGEMKVTVCTGCNSIASCDFSVMPDSLFPGAHGLPCACSLCSLYNHSFSGLRFRPWSLLVLGRVGHMCLLLLLLQQIVRPSLSVYVGCWVLPRSD